MLNNSQKQKPEGKFWFGLLVGGILGASGLFLLGTKKGRRLLKKILESTEELEDSLADVISEFEEKVEENSHLIPSKNVDAVLQKIKSAF